jgi:formimidoylglutamate deiminase
VAAGVPLSIGSDSNIRLDPFEELRELETVARRVAQRRLIVDVPTLLRAGGWGRIEAGMPADLIALAGDDPARLIFSGDASAVTRTWVAGS